MHLKHLWFSVLVVTGATSTSFAQNIEQGKLLAETCFGCHGVSGLKNAYPAYSVPKLGGQSAEYLISSLAAYKKGERDHGTMTAQASSLSDEEIQDIAAYFASLKEE